MGQVPQYLIIGNGRVARHFQQYFSDLQLSVSTWNRQESLSKLQQKIKSASHILVLISDQSIDSFVTTHLKNSSKIIIHFSGSLVTDNAFGAHPLSTFNENLYEREVYQNITFVVDHDAPAFETLFPGLPNGHVRLHKSLKPKYHAFCVLSGNFSCILWQNLFNTLEQEFNLPKEIAHLYLLQQTQNLIHHPRNALTGPLVRGDELTIKKNLASLENDPMQAIYKSFVNYYEDL